MYVRIVVIMLHSELYVLRHIQYASCLLHVFRRVCTYSLCKIRLNILYFGNYVNMPHMRNCPSKCASAMDACVQINIACTYTSVQFCEHHLCKLHRHIFFIIFHCTLHYICSFVLCTLLIGGNKELLLFPSN